MTQKEYPFWTPHEKAKLYRLFTGEIPVELKGGEVVSIEDNRYVYAGTFKWIEITSEQRGDERALTGLVGESGYLTIRTNSLKQFKVGDLVMLPKGGLEELWTITDGIDVQYVHTPRRLQTFQHLPLSSIG